MLQIQVSILVAKMKEESKKNSEGVTRRRLREKIASLSQPQVRRAADALSAIFTYFDGPMEPLAAPQKPTVTDLSTLLPNWHRVKLALLKSITTGIFIDAQFYAFNKTANSLPFDPKPLYISSIVIEEWGPAITTREWKNRPVYPTLIYDRRDRWHKFPGCLLGGWTSGRL